MVPWQRQDLATRKEAVLALAQSMPGRLLPASQVPNLYMLRRPTRNMEMDIHLGGGFPAAGCSFISGPDNSGKTRLLLEVMAAQQLIYGDDCILGWALAEGAFPYDQAMNVGLKIEVPDLMLNQWDEWRALRQMPPMTPEERARYKEQVGEFRFIVGATGEEILTGLLKAISTGAFSVIGIDSINGLLPGADALKELDKNPKKAAHAFMIDNFFRHYNPKTTGYGGPNETSVIFTQQVRANQERAFAPSHLQQYIKPWATGGAYAAKHYKLIDLVLWDGKVLKKGPKDGPKVAYGKMMNWMLDKGKAGTHDNLNGDVAFSYETGTIDVLGELITSALKRGVIQQAGNKWVVVRPDTREILPELTAPSQKAMRKMLEADFDYELALRREVLTAAGIQCLYR